MQMRKLGTLESEIVSHTVRNGRVEVVQRTVPGVKLPRIVRPIMRGKEVEFVDTRTFAEGAKGRLPFTQTFQTVNNITERAKVTGTITISDATGGGTTIFVQGECVVKITGLGGKVEGIIVENLKNAYRRLPLIVEEWMSIRHLHAHALESFGVSPGPGTVSTNPFVAAEASSAPPVPERLPGPPPRTSSGTSLGSGSFHSADSELDDALSEADSRAPPATPKEDLVTAADAGGGGGTGLTPHAFEPDTPPLPETPLSPRGGIKPATRAPWYGGGETLDDDIDSADESSGAPTARRLRAADAIRSSSSSEGRKRRGGAATTFAGRAWGRLRAAACCCEPAVALLSDEEDADSLDGGAGEVPLPSASEEDGDDTAELAGGWDAARNDALTTPLTPAGRKKSRARTSAAL